MVTLMIDTCLLIDYQREVKSKHPGAVASFLGAHRNARLQVSPIAWGEFLAGFESVDHPYVKFAEDRLDQVALPVEAASVYQRIYRYLKMNGNLIGANDLWIACHAMASGLALVSRNESDFKRVPGLSLITY
ncbi:MAG: type II toxin-antitoxin system VapC family toxin [Opitutales bacterium]|nr:type II toxin-antitoxin system VapC family toxin [Opitutales bacterium]